MTDRVIIVHESVRSSLTKDVGTLAVGLAFWSIGWFADSAALEWIGVVIAGLLAVGRAVSVLRDAKDKTSFTTPEAAKAWIDAHFGDN